MAKGSGGGGHGGSSGALSPRAVQALIAREGGAIAAITSRESDRFESLAKGRLEQVGLAYQGATRAQATEIATGRRDVMVNSASSKFAPQRLPPIKLLVTRDRDGKVDVHIEDGRNRSLGAKAAGATHIRATVAREHQDARGKWRAGKPVTILVKL